MTEPDPVTPTFTEPPTDPVTPEPAADSATSADPDESALDEHARKVIAAIRTDYKSERAKRQAAESARAELAQQVGKVLGLVKDEPVDPAQLTEQLASAGAAARQAQVELAVFRASQEAGADPTALLDSRTFLESVAQIDPSDGAAVTQAITAAIAANPRLGRSEPPAAPMRRNPAQGASASPPLGLTEQIAAAEKSGDVRESLRLKARMALNPQN